MKKKYVTFNPVLIKGIEDMGFKRKNKDYFCKDLNDGLTCSLLFNSYSPMPRWRSYYIMINITIPGLAESAEWINGPYPPGDTNLQGLGEITPKREFLSWETCNDTPWEEEMSVITDMIDKVKRYALPYIENLSTEEGIIRGIINKTFGKGIRGGIYVCPHYLFMKGYRREAIKYIEDLKKQMLESIEEEKKDRQLYARQWHELYVETTNRIYQRYNVSEDEIKEVLQEKKDLLHSLRRWL